MAPPRPPACMFYSLPTYSEAVVPHDLLYITQAACGLRKVCCLPDSCCLQARTVVGAQLYPVTALVEISLMAAILES